MSKISKIIAALNNLFLKTTAIEPQIATAVWVCPLGKEYPPDILNASGIGCILVSKTQGRYMQARLFKNWQAIIPTHQFQKM